MKFRFLIFPVVLILLIGCGEKKPESIREELAVLPDKIDFNFHVKPILSDKCFACHGPDGGTVKGGLRLDNAEDAFRHLGDDHSRFALVPGKLSRSEVYNRIFSDDDELIMPPIESNLSLSDREKAILVKWIEQGAEYKPHWSFIKPEPPKLPVIEGERWNKSPIDQLVAEKWTEMNLEPQPRADRETLIRRLSFDLTGLPPSLDEIDQFVNSNSPNAYENLVDRLLASPTYGERMAAIWMDVARYADSDGYLDDKHRNFSPWRDWVIDAYNKNMPYDEFVTWQLAGDLLPEKSKESILATAFNRLHKKNSEAGIIFEEFRVEYVADRVQTLSQGIMGLSVQCARCHDHKYDEISEEDYYKMFGFFNSTNEIGSPVYGPDQTPGPALLLTTEEQEDIIEFITKESGKLEQKLSQRRKELSEESGNWISKLNNRALQNEVSTSVNKSLTNYYPLDKVISSQKGESIIIDALNTNKPGSVKDPLFRPGVKGNAFFVTEYNTLSFGKQVGWNERTEPFSVEFWVYPDTVYEDVGVFYHCEDLRLGLKGYSLFLQNNHLQFRMAHSYPQNAIQVTSTEPIPAKEWTQITITYDGSSKAAGANIFVNGQMTEVTRDIDNLYKGILYEPDIHTYGFNGFTLGNRTHILPIHKGGIDEVKFYNRDLSGLEILYNYEKDSFQQSFDQLASGEKIALQKNYYLKTQSKELDQLKEELHEKRNKKNKILNKIPEIMVMGDLETPRPTYILERGNYDQHGKKVEPGVPNAIFPYDEDLPKNRLGLTKWLFDPDNPITARVYVNRLWQMLFGKGIVETSEDFGNQGDLPSHPKLLDFLAIEFIGSNWDVKAMLKMLVMSEVYQQTSRISAKSLEIDPENKFLARGPRFRMTAEMLRDNALAISDLLVESLGGESVYPYQPAGLWDELSNKSWRYKYLQEPGPGLYRRSIYTVWKRTSPPPSMLIFDAPERGECTVRRQETSTPLQALVLLNDPQYLEAARALAEKIIHEVPNDTNEQLNQAYKLITGRAPNPEEKDLLENFLKEEIRRFKEEPQKAIEYLSIGEKEWSRELDPEPLAALATVSNAIMNTNEGYTRK
ncbi:DUF1553 domain-containing protein [Membranihabitans maritimus]|uniref:DUF1553 domain-containing protein n=1 Tax=Membranihabitans maritimus TaxID=2904244 RepID=UPI001F31E1B7|nr:DUF1553 domain-containing protein [Membranihabitans maritimus]